MYSIRYQLHLYTATRVTFIVKSIGITSLLPQVKTPRGLSHHIKAIVTFTIENHTHTHTYLCIYMRRYVGRYM